MSLDPEIHSRDFTRRQALTVGGAAGAAAIITGTALGAGAAVASTRSAPAGAIPVVYDGTAQAVVVTEDDASDAVRHAAAELVTFVAKSTGVTLPTTSLPSNPPTGDVTAIYVGFTGPTSHPVLPRILNRSADDGFVITPYNGSITITGSTEWGTLNGVYEFLERYVGVAWLMPTTIGEDVPQRSSLAVPRRIVRSAPAFDQRSISPLLIEPGTGGPYPDQYVWAQRNRLQGNYNRPVEFHHNLHTFFPVSEYGDRPELYANGVVPAPGVLIGWQPAFSNPETVDIVVADILAMLAADPSLTSVSLGVNDGAYPSYETGLPIPETYYGWVNEVASQVTAVHPDMRFGLLAYHDLEVPPPFDLHPSVIPFLTEDRYAWIDPATRQHREDQLLEWSQCATELGTYDYLYGAPYAVPRMYLSLLADVYRTTYDLGVRYHYAELYPNWGEGPKPWVISRLLWDPDAEVSDLIEEWCRRAVGSQAADSLADYYQLWEDVWTTDIAQSPWFISHRTYQPFDSPSYLAAVDATVLDEAEALMNAVVATAETATPEQRERALTLASAHEYYDATARLFPRAVPVPDTTDAALEVAQSLLANLPTREALMTRRADWLAEAATDPILVQPLDPTRGGLTGLSVYNHYPIWALIEFLRAHEPSGGEVTQWLADHRNDHPLFARAADVITAALTPSVSIFTNSGFEDGMAGWSSWVTSRGVHSISTAEARSGSQSLEALSVDRGGPIQVLDAGPGILASQVWVKASADIGEATIQFALNLYNSAGQQVGTVRGESLRLQAYVGEWRSLTSVEEFVAPADPARAVATAQYIPILTGLPEGARVWFDDAEAYFVPYA
ncbi:DUF4838 domain-containing protein [Phytoactinopolyspora alkaliphila]|uniref:DUF4838 domain-containing protein n=1 Tax=Phytoactinopolyspora alkaliphila TaxID=1783498 RepID=A0A6N9YSD9_9ACTN|nr:DUF4838 domain-containing protein [Phytoactinopolyspora alkaliphila]NED97875.1 DUF4838 domain-containing protein [Phytoactinopolyspora alkaliphila]